MLMSVGSKALSLFYSTGDLKEFGCCPVIVDRALLVVMEGDHTGQLWTLPIFSSSLNSQFI